MKFKVGDKVQIKSLEWYTINKSKDNTVRTGGVSFMPNMAEFCGKQAIITRLIGHKYYSLDIDGGNYMWNDDMLEDKVCPPEFTYLLQYRGVLNGNIHYRRSITLDHKLTIKDIMEFENLNECYVLGFSKFE